MLPKTPHPTKIETNYYPVKPPPPVGGGYQQAAQVSTLFHHDGVMSCHLLLVRNARRALETEQTLSHVAACRLHAATVNAFSSTAETKNTSRN